MIADVCRVQRVRDVLEGEMLLFQVPVLMSNAEVVGRGFQEVVRHQEPVALFGLGAPAASSGRIAELKRSVRAREVRSL
jgi:hypothetical protein